MIILRVNETKRFHKVFKRFGFLYCFLYLIFFLVIICYTFNNSFAFKCDNFTEVVLDGKSISICDFSTEKFKYYASLRGSSRIEDNRYLVVERTGKVEKIFKTEGKEVSVGEALAIIDGVNADADLLKALAALEKSKFDYEVSRKMKEGDYSSSSTLISSATALKVAEANLVAANAAKERSIIRSNINGYIEKAEIKEGDFVVAGSQAFKILGKGARADLRIPQFLAYAIEKDMIAKVKFNNSILMDCRLSFFVKSFSHLNGFGKAVFDCDADDQADSLSPGLFAEANILVAEDSVYKIPGSAIFADSATNYTSMILYEEDNFKKIPVEVVKVDDEGVALVKAEYGDKVHVVVAGIEEAMNTDSKNKSY